MVSPSSQPEPEVQVRPSNKVDIVIPVFNGLEEYLMPCVASLKEHTGERLGRIIFVDDASTEYGIKDYCEAEGILVRNKVNRGFAASVNLGVKRTTTPIVAIINSDIKATANWLNPMVEKLETDPKTVVVGPLLLFPEDSRDPTRPAGKVQSCGFATSINGAPYHRHIAWSRDNPKVLTPRDDLQGITAACWVIRRSAWVDLGGLDESFGSYFEDVEYCVRARNAGMKIAYVPDSVLYHRVGASFERHPNKINLQERGALYLHKCQGKVHYDEWLML